ncbi:MAG: response regulator [Planctomycetota bacterium]
MATSKVLIVEDEAIFATDLADRVSAMGYTVVGVAANSSRAMEMAVSCAPDLVLMDIRIRGGMDGIELAALMSTSMDLPVVFLTAYADDATIQRASLTHPFGYLLKPINEQELRATLSTAMVRHLSEMRRRRTDRSQSALLASLPHAVLALDQQGRIAFFNTAARELLGCDDSAQGQPVGAILPLQDQTGAALSLPDAGGRLEGWMPTADGTRRQIRVQADAVSQVFPTDPEVLLLLSVVD